MYSTKLIVNKVKLEKIFLWCMLSLILVCFLLSTIAVMYDRDNGQFDQDTIWFNPSWSVCTPFLFLSIIAFLISILWFVLCIRTPIVKTAHKKIFILYIIIFVCTIISISMVSFSLLMKVKLYSWQLGSEKYWQIMNGTYKWLSPIISSSISLFLLSLSLFITYKNNVFAK